MLIARGMMVCCLVGCLAVADNHSPAPDGIVLHLAYGSPDQDWCLYRLTETGGHVRSELIVKGKVQETRQLDLAPLDKTIREVLVGMADRAVSEARVALTGPRTEEPQRLRFEVTSPAIRMNVVLAGTYAQVTTFVEGAPALRDLLRKVSDGMPKRYRFEVSSSDYSKMDVE